jgi:PAS domain S-box-containing protein
VRKLGARDRFIFHATVGYGVFAAVWIILSDRLLAAFADISAITWLSTVKGIAFVLVTVILLHFALRAVPDAGSAGPSLSMIETQLVGRGGSGRWPRWVTYAFAVALTLAILGVRMGLAVSFGERPLLILFMFPIILSALLGGLGPGLVATAVAALGTAYLGLPPQGNFGLAASHDLFQWAFLIANGVLVSVLSEALYRLRRRSESNRQLLNAVVSGTSDAIFVKDRQGRYVQCNEAAAEIIGRPVAQILGQKDTALFPAGEAATFADLDRIIIERGERQTREECVTTFSGAARTFLVTKGPIHDAQGEVAGLFGIARDITEHKQAEEAQERNRAMFQQLAEIGSDYFWDLDEQFRFTAISPWITTRSGLDYQNYLGKARWELPYLGMDEAKWAAHRATLAAHQPFRNLEMGLVNRDGEERWFAISGDPVFSSEGRFVGYRGVTRDITERRRADQALKARELLLTRMGQLAEVGGWGFDVATMKGSWTEEVARIHDVDYCDDISVEAGLSVFHGRHKEAVEAAVKEAIEQAKPYDLELEMLTPKGNRKWVRVMGQPLVREGRVVRVEGALQDITQRKRAEEEVRRLNAELEQRVQARTAELRAANKELDSFVYAVSHDLRAPLRAMNGFSQALAEDFGDQLSGEAKVFLDQIAQASRHMGELIDGLLTLSRSTRRELRHDPVNLSSLAEDLLAELVRSEPQRHVAWEIEPGLIAEGDARMMELLLRNLLGNAWKSTGKADAPRIRVFAEEHDGKRCFCIADNGAGFDMAHAAKLFEPFQRLHRQEEFPGLGIGLATVQRIVRRHGGEITANAMPGKGATFRFSLPVRRHGEVQSR